MTAARIGLFGGSFDPVHNAHLALARRALDELGLDELLWLPAGDPWQKTSAGVAVSPAAHREAMLALAIAGEPRFVLDRREITRDGPSYTIDTVRELRRERPGAQWFLIIGQDQLAGLHTWRDFRALLGLVTLAVAARPGAAPPADQDVAAAAVRRIALPPMAISATAIRSRVRRGEGIGALVPPAVAGYIDRHRLYQEPARDQREVKPLKPSAPPPAQHRGPIVPRPAARALMDIRKLQRAIVDGLEDVKAQHIAVFNTEHLSPLFERVIIASGTSNRQTKALASSVRESVKERGFPVPRMEGEENGEWIIVDCGAAVAHIMQPAIREYYRLEEIWGDKPVRMKLDGGASAAGSTKPAAAKRPAVPSERAGAPSKKAAAPAKKGRTPAGKETARAASASAKKPAAKRAVAADPARSRHAAPMATPGKAAPGKATAGRASSSRGAEARARKKPATRAAAPRATAPAGARASSKKAAQPSVRKAARTPRS